jgi:hypothetical protein
MVANPPRSKSVGKLKALLFGLGALLVLALLVDVWGRTSEFVAQDSCLDAGGRWIDGRCDGARPGG